MSKDKGNLKNSSTLLLPKATTLKLFSHQSHIPRDLTPVYRTCHPRTNWGVPEELVREAESQAPSLTH